VGGAEGADPAEPAVDPQAVKQYIFDLWHSLCRGGKKVRPPAVIAA
jgi:hypothetical protein